MSSNLANVSVINIMPPALNRQSAFSYRCNACGRCCRHKVIALSPHDVIAMARAARISTAEAVRRFTIRRGSMLRFGGDGRCAALAGIRCAIHAGRPLACRLYPLGIERGKDSECIVQLEPAPGSAGVYGMDGTVDDFLAAQGVPGCLAMNDRYGALLAPFRRRIRELVDFERIEPREFWRVAAREAMAESGYDDNPIIDAMFDADRFLPDRSSIERTVAAHIEGLKLMTLRCIDATVVAAAAVMLAISLGFSPHAASELDATTVRCMPP